MIFALNFSTVFGRSTSKSPRTRENSSGFSVDEVASAAREHMCTPIHTGSVAIVRAMIVRTLIGESFRSPWCGRGQARVGRRGFSFHLGRVGQFRRGDFALTIMFKQPARGLII